MGQAGLKHEKNNRVHDNVHEAGSLRCTQEFNNELIIQLSPLVIPRIRLMGLILKKNQLNIDFGNN